MVYSRGKSAVPERRGRGTRVLVLALGVLALIAIAAIVLSVAGLAPFGIPFRETELVRLWNAGEYEAVGAEAEALLTESPIDPEALTFAGFAHFYSGIEAVHQDEQLEAFDRSIFALRKAAALPRAPFAGERTYVLGKAYFHRGSLYMDLAVRYLEESLAAGFEADDIQTYLGLAYAELGKYDRSVAWFEEAIERAPEDVNEIRLKAAESYVAAGDYASAQATLESAIGALEDEFLVLIARNQLASVQILSGELAAARELLEQTIEIYPESADAYYYLGVISDQLGENVRARDYWRRAREIDPNHEDALRRLANWEG